MIEVVGDLWTYPADVRLVTTNNVIKQDGTAVMGSGVAYEAKTRWPNINKKLAEHLRQNGNVPGIIYVPDAEQEASYAAPWIVSFPTKDHWRHPSKMDLIIQSAHLVVQMADQYEWERIAMPRPGTGNGQLRWYDVKQMLEPILDDRFHVVVRPYLPF